MTAPTLIPMDGGETVKNEQETKKLLQGLEEKKTALFNEDSEFVARRPSDILEEQIRQIFPNFHNLVPETSFMFQPPKYNESVKTHVDPVPVVQHINLTLPNVTNNSGYERVAKELRQMQVNAIQEAHKRR